MGPDEELYGLKIARKAGRKTGSVYPILARLEAEGWVESRWERDDRDDRGPRRRFYRLSPDGLTAARALLIKNRGVISQRTEEGVPSPRPKLAPGHFFGRAVR